MGTRTRLLGDPHFSSASIGFRGHLTVGARETWIIAWTNMSQFCSDWAMRAFNSSMVARERRVEKSSEVRFWSS